MRNVPLELQIWCSCTIDACRAYTPKWMSLHLTFFAGFPALKPQFIKYCKPFEKRLRSLHRVIPVNKEQPTSLSVTGFISSQNGNPRVKIQ